MSIIILGIQMMNIQSVKREQIKDTTLMDEILRLDQDNMKPIFQKLGQEMPFDRRKLAFNSPGKIIFASDDAGCLVGYLEYSPGWDDPKEIYISSIQIVTKYQNGMVLLLLIRHAINNCEFYRGQIIRTHGQKSNESAIRIYKRLGFDLDESSDNNGTLSAIMVYPPKWPTKNLKNEGL